MDVVHLVPPMADDPPPGFVAFVYAHLPAVQQEAHRLTGGNPDEVYPGALTDLALHWRRLRLAALVRSTAPGDYLVRRLTKRAAAWRKDQVYEIEVSILKPQTWHRPPAETIAQRKAALLDPTERPEIRPLAEATIAWAHAQRTAFWRGIARTTTTAVVVMIVLAGLLPTTTRGY